MITEDVAQAISIELRHVVREGWSVTNQGDSLVVVGPDSPDFVSEVWRIARFIAYDEYVSIERQPEHAREYRIESRSRSGTWFQVQVRGE